MRGRFFEISLNALARVDPERDVGPETPILSGGELFIVDNSESEWKGLRYLEEWAEIASWFDIATGYFEMGALLALDGKWQKLDKIPILMADEICVRTRQAILGRERTGSRLYITLHYIIHYITH
jgi:hypothetical protein